MLRASRWLWLNAEEYGMDQDRLYVAGHSAGGHLTAMLMCALWPVFDRALPKDLWKGGLAISGLYDLRPLVDVDWLNSDLRLDAASALQALARVHSPGDARAGDDLRRRQTNRASSCARTRCSASAGAPPSPATSRCPARNHFSVVDGLAEQKSALFAGARRLMKLDK